MCKGSLYEEVGELDGWTDGTSNGKEKGNSLITVV